MIRLEFVAACHVCGVPAKGVLVLEWAPSWQWSAEMGHGMGGELLANGWHCAACADAVGRLAVGDGAR